METYNIVTIVFLCIVIFIIFPIFISQVIKAKRREKERIKDFQNFIKKLDDTSIYYNNNKSEKVPKKDKKDK